MDIYSHIHAKAMSQIEIFRYQNTANQSSVNPWLLKVNFRRAAFTFERIESPI